MENISEEILEKIYQLKYKKMKQVLTYFFRKKDPNRPTNFNIKAMHFINKASILIFIVALAIYIIRKFM